MRFSVVIATCGRWERLAVTLGRVKAAVAKHGGVDEVLVVDNSPEVAGCGLQVAGCTWLKSKPLNKSTALNVGIEAAANDWIAFTDDDCLPDVDWLCQAEVFVKESGVRCFGGRVVPGLDAGGLPKWLQPGKSGLMPQHGSVVRYEPGQPSGTIPRFVRKPIGANFFCRKDVFQEHGGYDEELWDRCGKAAIGSDDGGMMVKLDREGEPVGYCAESIVIHPVYSERAVVLHHLRAAFRLGYRDSIVLGERGSWRWTLRQLCVNLFRAMARWMGGDLAAAVYYLENGAVAWGKLWFCVRRGRPL